MQNTIIHEENPATSGKIITINEQEVRGYLNFCLNLRER